MGETTSVSEEEFICIRCGDCCKNFFFKMSISEHQDLINYLQSRHKHPQGYWTMEPNGTLVLIINVPCDHLKEDNLCDDYENRPKICRGYLCKKHSR